MRRLLVAGATPSLLVAGATGAAATRLVELAAAAGWQVLGLCRTPRPDADRKSVV